MTATEVQKKIVETLPAYFNDIEESFEGEDVAVAMRELGNLVRDGVITQFRSYFVHGRRLETTAEPVAEPVIDWGDIPTVDEPQPAEDEQVDFVFEPHGTLVLLWPQTREARKHLKDNVSEDAQWYGGALVVEPRFAEDVLNRVMAEGFSVRKD